MREQGTTFTIGIERQDQQGLAVLRFYHYPYPISKTYTITPTRHSAIAFDAIWPNRIYQISVSLKHLDQSLQELQPFIGSDVSTLFKDSVRSGLAVTEILLTDQQFQAIAELQADSPATPRHLRPICRIQSELFKEPVIKPL